MVNKESYNESEKKLMLQTARKSIQTGIKTGRATTIDANAYPEKLRHKRATFVTLHKLTGSDHKQLRGCIGTISAESALITSIAQNAFSAAFNDTRFAPVKADELEQIIISISILTPAKPLQFNNEGDLLNQIQPGIDGLILEDGYNRGLFLPSVWESLSEKQTFLRELKRKAGLPMDYWSDTLTVNVFHTLSFSEDSD